MKNESIESSFGQPAQFDWKRHDENVRMDEFWKNACKHQKKHFYDSWAHFGTSCGHCTLEKREQGLKMWNTIISNKITSSSDYEHTIEDTVTNNDWLAKHRDQLETILRRAKE